MCGPGSSVSTATDYGLEGRGSNLGRDDIVRPFRPALGPTQPPINGYRVFLGGKVRPGRVSDHSPPSNAAVMEENHPLGHTGPVTGSLYLLTNNIDMRIKRLSLLLWINAVGVSGYTLTSK